ncbi:hypothetical protein ACFWY6_13130 [Streptomyces sp. NPDC059037]|uniref:hypothetical protein n=1 Tax=Streptomyces sp. NPDC059037 TaxID=3346710 RepID=UPI00369F8BF7
MAQTAVRREDPQAEQVDDVVGTRASCSTRARSPRRLHWYRAMPFNPPGRLAEVTVPTLCVPGDSDPALGRTGADSPAGS